MLPSSLERAALRVLGQYFAQTSPIRLLELGNHGGFSGARLWRVECEGASYCLRAWPPGDPSRERLRWIHDLMDIAVDGGLEFVPVIQRTREKQDWVEHAGRLWELSTWMAGTANFHERPSRNRLESSCVALARLHYAWAGLSVQAGPCPGIERRLQRAQEWRELIKSGWLPPFASLANQQIRNRSERAWSLLRLWADRVPAALAPWAGLTFPLQLCLCDIWHDHVLFEKETVQGFIDFGGVKIDHVSVDLARLLGSMVGDDAVEREAGLCAYSRLRPLSAEEWALVRVLDETGTVIGMLNWLKWLYLERKALEDLDAVADRLGALVERVEKWDESYLCRQIRNTKGTRPQRSRPL